MEQQINRFVKPMQEWKQSQQRLSSVFSAQVLKTRAFEREQLAFQENLLKRVQGPLSMEERITRRLLEQQRRELERKLYPSFLVRLVRSAVIFSSEQVKTYRKRQEGWRPNRQPIARAEVELSRLLTARQQKPEVELAQQFKGQDKFSQEQQRNLLEGRSVEKEGKWFKLDMTDVDKRGRHPLRELPFKFDLDKELQKLPLFSRSGVAEMLRNGQRAIVEIQSSNGVRNIHIEASPMVMALNLYDEHGKKMSTKQALGQEETSKLSIARQRRTGMQVN